MTRPKFVVVFAWLASHATISCAAAPPRQEPPPSASPASSAPPPASVASSEPSPSPPPASASPAPPTALDRAHDAAARLAAIPATEAAWLPFRILELIARSTGELPAPSAPTREDDVNTWSLVMNASPHPRDASAYASSCDDVMRAEPRAVCFVDTVAMNATDRIRFAFAWRAAAGDVGANLGTPLRAMSRLSTGLCMVSAERTAHTLELLVQVPDMHALSMSLALIATAPRLSDVFLVATENVTTRTGSAVKALLTWPTDRVDSAHADLADDPWPPRCDDHDTVAADVARSTAVVPEMPVTGERARGAVVRVARRAWIVTDGDRVADARIVSVSDRGVYVRREGGGHAAPRLVRFAPAPTVRPQPATEHHPIHLPLPPEPAAPLP